MSLVAALTRAAQIAGSSRGAKRSDSSIGTPSASPQAAAVWRALVLPE
jgi:hypothetical protein